MHGCRCCLLRGAGAIPCHLRARRLARIDPPAGTAADPSRAPRVTRCRAPQFQLCAPYRRQARPGQIAVRSMPMKSFRSVRVEASGGGADVNAIWRSCKSKELEVLLVLVETVMDDLCGGEAHDVVVLPAAGGVHFQTGVLVAVADHPAAVGRHR